MKKLVALLAVSTALSSGIQVHAQDEKLEVFNQKREMQAVLQEIVDDFNKENGTKVELVTVPDAGNVLKTRMANGDAPDVINIYPQNMDFQLWAKDGQFVDLTEQEFLSKLKPGSAEQYAVDNKIYNLPLTTNAWGFFYNVDKFKELGLEVPKTWDEFEKLVATIKEKGETPFAGSFSTADSWSLNGYHQLAWATVAGGFDGANDYLRHSEQGAIKGDDEKLQAVAKRLRLLTGSAQKNANGASYADAIATFAKGEALIMPQGIWALPAINEQKPGFKVASFPFPGEKEGEEMTVGAADLAFSVSESSKNKELALKFLDYLSNEDVLRKYYKVDGMPTSLTALENESGFEETKGVTDLAFTEKQIVWLQKEWDSEEGFWHLTTDFINDDSATPDVLAQYLNNFFDPMKH
ncbi:ABC transporter substrate-binding protein [Tuanshanicoccus lijuaniae]|uniref:ABC transporter substrate-binding protein n=1 Tax=Aerococcaceae bacterium zg-1292 TaxID=2774330 RepID=UPI001BD83E74|nr:extracellular solute-binding protein [Aerococcaceae bacterium zg-A91]MBS4457901.1 extracellular solute-binding protein [Aerococcaceae bacterium zg-BR33]